MAENPQCEAVGDCGMKGRPMWASLQSLVPTHTVEKCLDVDGDEEVIGAMRWPVSTKEFNHR